MMTRDKRVMFNVCTLITALFFGFGCAGTNVAKRELYDSVEEGGLRTSPSVVGMCSYGGNFFSSASRSGRSWETSWKEGGARAAPAGVSQGASGGGGAGEGRGHTH